MAFEGCQPLKWTFVAAGDLTASQYHFVKLDANGDIVAVAAIDDMPIGVVQNNPNVGEEAEVVIAGITKVVASEIMAPAETVGTAVDGRATGNPGATVHIVGKVLLGAGAADRIATAVIDCAATTVA